MAWRSLHAEARRDFDLWNTRGANLFTCQGKVRYIDRATGTVFAPPRRVLDGGTSMRWMKPTIEEVCIGLEINDYFPAEL
ncbi:MAG: pyrroloquinoline quinone precursor peptide PqqA [Parvibaculaceae bacterium]